MKLRIVIGDSVRRISGAGEFSEGYDVGEFVGWEV